MAHEAAKRAAAKAACAWIFDGMVVGLGTGSTALFVIERVAEMVGGGLAVRCVPTSLATANEASRRGLELVSLEDVEAVDVVIDGADEVDRAGNLIKGGGGALLREKLVAISSRERIIVVDETKLVERLGLAFHLPIEIVAFGWKQTLARLAAFGAPRLRRQGPADGTPPVLSDNQNFIVDLAVPGGIAPADALALERNLRSTAGVIECGLFIGLTTRVIVGSDDRQTRTIEIKR